MRSDKTELMKKFILANKIFIVLQIVFVMSGIICDFVFDDTAVFLTAFIHVGVFVVFNVIVESIVEYGYLMKKYAKICDETHSLRYFKLKKRMYKASKNERDTITSTLILQSAVKSLIVIMNLILLLFTVSFE